MRLLVAGDVRGEIEKVFNRVRKLKAKGQNFDALLAMVLKTHKKSQKNPRKGPQTPLERS